MDLSIKVLVTMETLTRIIRPYRRRPNVSKFLKYFLFFVNFIIWIISFFVLAVGTWAYSEKSKNRPQNVNITNPVFDAALILIIVGIFALVVSSAGCIGAIRENCCLLKMFAAALSILIILQITAALLVVILSTKIKRFAEEKIGMEAIKRYRDDEDLKNIVDWMQVSKQITKY